MPGVLKFIDELPSVFHFVPSCKEGGISGHGIQEEAFIGLGTGFAER